MEKIKKPKIWIPIAVVVIAIIVGVAISLIMKPIGPPTPTAPVTLKFSSFKEGSAWYVYASAMADIIKKYLPPGSRIDVLPYPGGTAAPVLIGMKKEADIGFGFSIFNKWAYEGKVVPEYGNGIRNLRGLVGGLDQYAYGIGVRKDLGIANIGDFVRKAGELRLMTLPKGSTGEYVARTILDVYGLKYEDFKSVEHADFKTIISKIRDGHADALMQVITKGHPGWTELTTVTDIIFIGLDEEGLRKLEQLGYTRFVIPTEWGFRGMEKDVPSIGFTTVLMTTDELPSEVAYAITKAIIENKERLAAAHKALKVFNPEMAWKPELLGIPLHPGAESYYKEKGLIS